MRSQETSSTPTTAEMQEQVTEQVFALLDRLNDPQDSLSAAFYGEHGVQDRPLRGVRHPFAGSTVLLADETSHVVRSGDQAYDVRNFKRRGALLAALVKLEETPQTPGFVTASAGNHALGVAAAAWALGRKAEIYCRKDISPAKRDKLEYEFGAKVKADYSTLEQALRAAEGSTKFGRQRDRLAFIHPFDDIAMITGAAQLGMHVAREVSTWRQAGELDPSVEVEVGVNVGGGGLLAGMLLGLERAMQREMVDRNVSVVGAQMVGANAMELALRGERMTYFDPSCDGTAVRRVGQRTLAVAAHSPLLKAVRSVEKPAVGTAMRTLAGQLHKRVEPAAALAWAVQFEDAVACRDAGMAGKKVYVPLVTGANVTSDRYEEYQTAASEPPTSLGSRDYRRDSRYDKRSPAPLYVSGERRGLNVWN